jgi:serine/threonine protein kinase/tetratricopeptide (TPR) repeat protein
VPVSLAIGSRLGPYEVLAPLGAGGMGEVYRARDTRLGRDVAVKVVHPRLASDPDRLSRFEKEARAAAQLDHPNILVVHDIGTHEGSPFIVSELLQGESLREKLGNPLPPKKAVDYAIHIAHGLAAAHEKGIVHRDIKPENVFVTKDGHVKILDFGVAKLLPSFEPSGVDTQTPTESATQPGTAVGTVAYMSPEQIRGQPVDPRSDLFSLGVVFYEMLSGKRPFQRETAAETMAATLREEPPDLTETNRSVPAALENVVRHCLEKEPESRFQSARDVVFAIEALPEISTARPTAPMSPAGVWLHRHRTSLSGTAVVLELAVAGALILANRKHSVVSSVLALPCTVYGATEMAFLTDAVPGTISTFLSEVEGLDTKVPPTSLEVEKIKGDLTKLAELYQVSSFIVTSITPSPGRFALNVQLVDAATRKVRWGKQYEGSRETYNDLARQAAEGIRLAVSPAAAPVPTSGVSSEAELAFQLGKYYRVRAWGHGDRSDFERALEAFKHALELNPKDSATAASISALYHQTTYNGTSYIPRVQGLAEANAWMQKALDLDPKCSEAWALSALLEMEKPDADMRKQIELSLKAAQLGPRNAPAQRTFAQMGLATGGSLSLAVEALRPVLRQDPLAFGTYANLARFLTTFGRPEEALSVLSTVLSLDPGHHWALLYKVHALVEMSRTKEAAALFKQTEANWNSGSNEIVQYVKSLVSVAADDDKDAGSSLKAIRATFADPQVEWNALQDEIDTLLPAVSRRFGKDAALDLLILSTNRGATMPYDALMLRPDLKELREDPRAADVIKKTKAPFDLLMRILRDARARGELPKYLERPMDELLRKLTERGAWSG